MTHHQPDVPAPLGSFFGRERELAAAAERLRRPEARLVTLTGPPGIGKTALAQHLLAEVSADFHDGVVLVPLEAVHDPSLVVTSIASALGLPQSEQTSEIDQVAEWLAGRHVLLFLDNFEQVIESAPLLPRLLERAHRATCLVTSREALDVRGEYEIPVPPLPVPDLVRFQGMRPEPLVQALLQYPSVRLFCERAEAVDPTFQMTADNATRVASACRRLDGIPLALELAASRLKVMSIDALEDQLAHAAAPALLDLLGRGRRDSPERHRTLLAAIDWSYQLLDPREQQLFRALAAFADGWTLDAARAIVKSDGNACAPRAGTAAGPYEPREREHRNLDPLEAMAALAAKSLIYPVRDKAGAPPRWAMLQALRSYALTRLRADPAEWRAVHQAQYRWAMDLAAPLPSASAALLDRIDIERGNLRGIVEWALMEADPAIGLRLGERLWRFWLARTHLFEGRRLLQRILDVPDRPDDALLARVLYGAAMLAQQQGDLTDMRHHLTRALAVLRSGEADEENAVAIASASTSLGRVLAFGGDLDEAARLIDEGLVVLRRSGAPRELASGLAARGQVDYLLDRPLVAAALLDEGAALYRSVDDRILEGTTLGTLGLALADVDPARARVAATEALRLHEAAGNTRGIAKNRAVLGVIACAEGDYDLADTELRQAIGLLTSLGDLLYTSYGLVHLGVAAQSLGRDEEAVRIAAAAQAFTDRTGSPMLMLPRVAAKHRDLVATLRESLGADAFERAWSEGMIRSLEEIVTGSRSGADAARATPDTGGSSPDLSVAGLTTRETEVLALVASGLSDAEVAERLFLSARTVHAHLRSIYGKLGVNNRRAAARLANEHGPGG